MWRKLVQPFFYIEDIKLRQLDPQNLRPFGVRKTPEYGPRSMWKRPTVKLTVRSPNNVTRLTRYLAKVYKVRLLEADLAKKSKLAQQYMISHGITSGFTLNDDNIMSPVDVECPLRIWWLDFECRSNLINSVNPERDEPICMVTWFDNYTNKYYTIHTHEYDFRSRLKNHIVVKVKDEKELLLTLIKYLDKLQEPDMIVAHNLYRYDLVKWISRLEKYEIDPDILSPKPFRNVDKRRIETMVVKGRIFFDALKAYMYYTNKESMSYSQEYIMKELEVDVPKVPFDYPIAELWDDKAPIQWSDLPNNIKEYLYEEDFRPSYIVFIRNLLDIVGLIGYMEKVDLIEYYDGMRRDLGCLYTDLFFTNRRLDTALLRLCHGKVALPTAVGRGKGGGFAGGVVLEPEPGRYYRIAVADFTREYPSIIKALNISPEMFINPPSDMAADDFYELMLAVTSSYGKTTRSMPLSRKRKASSRSLLTSSGRHETGTPSLNGKQLRTAMTPRPSTGRSLSSDQRIPLMPSSVSWDTRRSVYSKMNALQLSLSWRDLAL
jgi:DNA polymerase elongation subunit (family B)